MVRSLVFAALLVATDVSTGAAQGPRAALQQIGIGKPVRVSTKGHRLDGRIASIDANDLLLRGGDVETRIPIAGIDSVWRRRGAYGTGALIGGVIGAAAFTGFLHLIVNIVCEEGDSCRADHRRAWGYGIVIGGAGGALVGAGVGGLFRRWDRVDP